MLLKEKNRIRAAVSIRVVEHQGAGNHPQRNPTGVDDSAEASIALFQSSGNLAATFAERFPHLMVSAIAVSVILTAITAEIECLRAMGYYWP